MLLKVDNLQVMYADLSVIKGISFEVSEGEVVVILGANAAGKSTLLRALSGLVRPSSGTCRYGGVHTEKLMAHKIVELGMAHVPEGGQLFPEMAVFDNLLMGCFTERARKQKESSLEMVFDYFPILKERLKQIAGTLSGGERQMLAIARGLMSRPKMIIFDEPSLGLAPKFIETIFQIIKRINKDGVTVLLVEQNARQALQIADRGYVLERGKINLSDSAQKLANNDYVKKAYLGY